MLVGTLKGEELAREYQSATVFVQPSLEEGLSLVIGEALGAGLPVLATTNTGASELFEDSEAGFIVPIRNPAILAEKLQFWADCPEERDRMADAARSVVKRFGGWQASQRNLVRVLGRTLA